MLTHNESINAIKAPFESNTGLFQATLLKPTLFYFHPTLSANPGIVDLTKLLQSLFHEDRILFTVAIGILMDWRGPVKAEAKGGLLRDVFSPMGRPPSPKKRHDFW